MPFIPKISNGLRVWTLRWARSPHMAIALFLIAFFEASFFPIPPDILLIAILMASASPAIGGFSRHKERSWWWYAGIATLGSVLGALLGYAIGWGFYETVGFRIADAYNLNGAIKFIGSKFEQHVFLTIFTAAFTIIPFKVFTISAGLFKVSVWQMVFASILGRGLRFFAIAYFVKTFGRRLNHLIMKYFNIVSIVFIGILIAAFVVYKLAS